MAEMPAPAAAAPVSVELLVAVEVTVAVEEAEPAPAVALEPSAEERMERALAPVVAAVEADWRASDGVVS
jgi:hypothetical protein